MALVLSFKDVSKEYKRGKESIAVLDHFNLEIAEKDLVAIMGPSGSGKTTLLNLIGGLDRPSTGEITVGGERLDQLSGSRPFKMAFVSRRLHPRFPLDPKASRGSVRHHIAGSLRQ